MTIPDIDFSDDVAGDDTVHAATPVAEVVARWVAAKDKVAFYEQQFKAAKHEVRELEQQTIPAIMLQTGQSKAVLTDGTKVDVKPFTSANIPTISAINDAPPDEQAALLDQRKRCFAWLRAVGQGSIIRSGLFVDLGKDPEARKLVQEYLAILEVPFDETEAVHPQTLSKCLRELIQQGVTIPQDAADDLSLFVGSRANIKPPKKA